MSTIPLPENVNDCHQLIIKQVYLIEELKLIIKLLKQKLFGQSSEKSKFFEMLEEKAAARASKELNETGTIQGELFTDILEEIKAYEEQLKAKELAQEATQETTPETTPEVTPETTPEANPEAQEVAQNEKIQKKRAPKSKHFKGLEGLIQEDIHYGQDIDACDHCHSKELKEFNADYSKELEIIPSKIILKNHIVHNMSCKSCGKVTRKPAPQSPLHKCIAGPELLTDILYNRFVLFATYYRLHESYLGYGVDISEANMVRWMQAVSSDIFTPLYNEIKSLILTEPVIYADETVIKELNKGKCNTKYFWFYSGKVSKYTFIEYSSRSRENPTGALGNVRGTILVTDKYSGYDEICKQNNIRRSFCWAHARRKFSDFLKASGKDGPIEVKKIFKLISEMLESDAQIRDGDKNNIVELRNERVRPKIDTIIEQLKTFLAKNVVMPSQLENAINYILKSPDEFKTFLAHPDCDPTNNYSERRIRSIAIGRKNWLFTGSKNGGDTIAIIQTIVTCARAFGLNMRAYISHLIRNLPNAKMSEVKQFLPHNCLQFES